MVVRIEKRIKSWIVQIVQICLAADIFSPRWVVHIRIAIFYALFRCIDEFF